jgi:hypothetical protein
MRMMGGGKQKGGTKKEEGPDGNSPIFSLFFYFYGVLYFILSTEYGVPILFYVTHFLLD